MNEFYSEAAPQKEEAGHNLAKLKCTECVVPMQVNIISCFIIGIAPALAVAAGMTKGHGDMHGPDSVAGSRMLLRRFVIGCLAETVFMSNSISYSTQPSSTLPRPEAPA